MLSRNLWSAFRDRFAESAPDGCQVLVFRFSAHVHHGDRSVFRQHVLNLLAVSDADPLHVVEIHILFRGGLDGGSIDGCDAIRILVPIIGGQAVILHGEPVVEDLGRLFERKREIRDDRAVRVVEFGFAASVRC